MSKLIVITFEGLSQARQARRALDDLDREYFDLIDAAVVTKDAYGRVDIDNEVESSTRTGTLIGRLLGAPLAMLFPVGGAVAGAVGGAAVSKAVEPGIEQEFIDQVAETLKLDGSALVFLFDAYEKYELPQVIAMLRPFKSTVYQTTLTYEEGFAPGSGITWTLKPNMTLFISEQAEYPRLGYCLSTAGGPQLLKDIADVALDGIDGKNKLLGYVGMDAPAPAGAVPQAPARSTARPE